MKIGAVIQARMGSTRLPGKVLRDLKGMTVLEHVVRRVRSAKAVPHLVVATTTESSDDPIVRLCCDLGIDCYRGSGDDVLDRFYRAAVEYGLDVVVRVTADDPFKDPDVIDRAVQEFLSGNFDYVSNTIQPTYPEGLDIEVFSFDSLRTAHSQASLPSEREHVTPYIWKHGELFRLHSFSLDVNLSAMRWTLDDERDWEFVQAVYDALYDEDRVFRMQDILDLLLRRPELMAINTGTERNEGYQRSVERDLQSAGSMPRTMSRVGVNERRYVLEVLDTQFRSSKGSAMMKRLEDAFCEKLGVKYAIAHCNGTATLHSALVAAGVGIGDEVIVPPLTMSSTAFAVLHANALPVFADVDLNTFTISSESIEERITPRTKAIIPVSLYGLSPDMDRIMAIAQKHGLVVIEDDAQCFLGKYKGRIVGTIGHLSSFSFQSSKHMTSGEGGMVVTDDLDLATKVRRFSSLGYAGVGAGKGKITKEDIQDPQYERHVSIGFNYRMSEPCCAIALGQLERLELLVAQRVRVAGLYAEAIGGCDWLIPQAVPDGYESSYWTFVVRLNHPRISWYDFRNKYRELGGDGIYAAWQLTYLEPAFRHRAFNGLERLFQEPWHDGHLQKYDRGLCPVAEYLQPRLLQFKTNYWDIAQAERQAEILAETIRFFD